MWRPKDELLAGLAKRFNVAQFVSFSPGVSPKIRDCRIRGHASPVEFEGVEEAIKALLNVSAGSVNVRSFRLGQDKGNPFEYGIATAAEAAAKVRSLAAEGYFTIVNETIDTHDGGVSGVVMGGIMEFTPLDTPRGVEKPGAVSVPYELGIGMLRTIYGFQPELSAEADDRIEFSVHPIRVGYRRSHTLLWEIESIAPVRLETRLRWPNRLSKLIGDKAFGLLVAHLLDLPVPRTAVIARTVAPFTFGRSTGTSEFWMRTCPQEPQPGKYTTTFGWNDPYRIMALEDPDGTAIASVLAQEGVAATYSGASLPGAVGEPNHVEGVAGRGDDFMLGERNPEDLPSWVVQDVQEIAARASEVLGPVRMEFVHDGQQAWVVQLHLSSTSYQPGVISPGSPGNGWLEFDPALGLPKLKELIERAERGGNGIRVVAPVGITSHVGDLLRRARIPARLEPKG